MACTAAAFGIYARLNRHDDACKRIGELSQQLPASSQLQGMARVLGEIARTYPAAPVQHRSADLARVVIARRLDLAPAMEQQTRR
jgi:hypothetical protein